MCSFVSYRTSQYKLHYFEAPTNIKFVMLTDLKSPSMRPALEQIYINLYVEYGTSESRNECGSRYPNSCADPIALQQWSRIRFRRWSILMV